MAREEKIAFFLAQNIISLRKKRGLSQDQLSQLSDIPRSTLTHIESGSGNPSLQNLAKLSNALQIGIEELLSRPRNDCQLLSEDEIVVQKKNGGKVKIFKLLPDRIKGLEVDRMELQEATSMAGRPHLIGAKEYLTVLKGELTVFVAGEEFRVRRGSVLAFPGDQSHSYRNTGTGVAMAISVVIPVVLGADPFRGRT